MIEWNKCCDRNMTCAMRVKTGMLYNERATFEKWGFYAMEK